MKKTVSLFLILMLLVAGIPAFTEVDFSAMADTEGTWWLDSIDYQDPNPAKNITTSISEGSAALKVVSPDSGDVFEASMNWTAPGTSYKAGSIVEITIGVQVDNYVWNGEDDGYIHMGLNYMSAQILARIDASDVNYGGVTGRAIYLEDADGNYQGLVNTDNGKILTASQSYKVSAQFPAGNQNGEKISLHVTCSGGLARYNYVWQAAPVETTNAPAETTAAPDQPTPTPIPAEKTIVLAGKVTGIDGRPMRRMKLDFTAWFDAAEGIPGSGDGDWQFASSTDGSGRFKAVIPVPEGQEKPVQIMMRGELRCVLPDGSETYYIVDMREPQAHDNIQVSSWFEVDVTDPAYEDEAIIPVYRLASFSHLPLGAWTFGGQWELQPDAFVSNVSDLESLAAHSYTYNMFWEAQFVGGYVFDEIEKLKKETLRIETNWAEPDQNSDLSISHFEPSDMAIRLTDYNSRFDDLSRFTFLHEYGHYFDVMSNNGVYRTLMSRQDGERHINHGGYMNSSTSDSFMEGFATAYAGLVQQTAGMANPHLAGAVDLSNIGYYTAWGVNGTEEELAISVLLYQMLFSYDAPREYWSALQPDRSDFYAYYQAFEDSLNKNGLERLEELALAGGLYQMPFGSGTYDFGEPFIDMPEGKGNGKYDSNERYADLMYETSENGYVDIENPLEDYRKDYDPDDLLLGQAADAGRSARRTTLLHSNSFLYLDSSVSSLPQSLLLTFDYGRGRIAKMLFPVMNIDGSDMVYIGLPGQPVKGRLEVSVPGGKKIFEDKLEDLHEQFISTIGQNVPLAWVEIDDSDLAAGSVIAAPAEGDPKAKGIIQLPDLEDIEKANQQAGEEAEEFDPQSGLEAYGELRSANNESWGFSESGTGGVSGPDKTNSSLSGVKIFLIILGIVLVLAIGVLITVLLITKSRKAKEVRPVSTYGDIPPAGRQQYDSKLSSAPVLQAQNSPVYCPNCGSSLEPGSTFCGSCGQRIE
jgi:hypothetical protein